MHDETVETTRTAMDAMRDVKAIADEFGVAFTLADPGATVSVEQRTINELFFALLEARAAIGAMPEPPLDDLLNSIWPDMYISEIAKNPGRTSERGWQVVVSDHEKMHFGIGEDLDAAIRTAVANAQEGDDGR